MNRLKLFLKILKGQSPTRNNGPWLSIKHSQQSYTPLSPVLSHHPAPANRTRHPLDGSTLLNSAVTHPSSANRYCSSARPPDRSLSRVMTAPSPPPLTTAEAIHKVTAAAGSGSVRSVLPPPQQGQAVTPTLLMQSNRSQDHDQQGSLTWLARNTVSSSAGKLPCQGNWHRHVAHRISIYRNKK